MPHVPKAVLYHSPSSVWSAVVLLALEEKGYARDEIDLRVVDLGKGENFDPSFLRLNPKATVPVLVVPYENSLGDEDSLYKALTETKTIVEFLDKSRSALSRTHSTSNAPAPSLTPATMASLTTCKTIVEEIVHSKEANPEALRYLNARDEESLRGLGKEVVPELEQRRGVLRGYLRQTETEELKVSEKVKRLWREKLEATEATLGVLEDAEKTERELAEEGRAKRAGFYKSAKEAWEAKLGGLLERLSTEMVGPYALGDQFSVADLHMAGWLAGIVRLCGGLGTDDGKTAVARLEERTGVKLAETRATKLSAFWDSVRTRPSWQTVYGKNK